MRDLTLADTRKAKDMTSMVVLPGATGVQPDLGMGGGGGTSTPVIVPGSVEVGASVQMTFAYQEGRS